MQDESLLTSTVPRSLETKNKILGLELSDVLLLLMNVSVQNLIFGSTGFKIPMVFGTSTVLAIVLFLFKKGKPDFYLQHLMEHFVSPTVLSANSRDTEYRKFRIGGENEK